MDETPPPDERDVERELRARVTIEDDPELEPEWPPPVRPSLRRRAEGKWVAGVAGGLADLWRVPALALRIPLTIAGLVSALVVWEVLTGGGTIDPSDGVVGLIVAGSIAAAVAYVVMWIVVPREDVPRSPAGRLAERYRPRRLTERYPNLRSIPGFVLLAIGGAILAERLGIWQPDLVLAAGLIALGVWLYRRDRAAPPDVQVVEPATREAVAVAVDPVPAAAPPVVRTPRERSPLGWITFGVALLVVCVAAIWTSLAGDTLSTVHRAAGLARIATIPAVGLLVLAAGLAVGSVFGRARWLILPAALVTPLVLMTSVIRLPLEGGFGNAYLGPRDLEEVGVTTKANTVGSIYVDLGRFQGEQDVERELRLSTVAGTVTVVVPYDAHVRVDAFTGIGTLGLGREHAQGLEISNDASLEPKHGDGATFTVHAAVGFGDVYVLRYSPMKRELRELRRAERAAEREAAA